MTTCARPKHRGADLVDRVARALANARLPDDLHVHHLRHTCLTQWSASLGEPLNRMGHSSTRAARIYLHAREERERQLAATLDKMARRELEPLLLDEMFSDDIAQQLRAKGCDVIPVVADPALTGLPDDQILAYATTEPYPNCSPQTGHGRAAPAQVLYRLHRPFGARTAGRAQAAAINDPTILAPGQRLVTLCRLLSKRSAHKQVVDPRIPNPRYARWYIRAHTGPLFCCGLCFPDRAVLSAQIGGLAARPVRR